MMYCIILYYIVLYCVICIVLVVAVESVIKSLHSIFDRSKDVEDVSFVPFAEDRILEGDNDNKDSLFEAIENGQVEEDLQEERNGDKRTMSYARGLSNIELSSKTSKVYPVACNEDVDGYENC